MVEINPEEIFSLANGSRKKFIFHMQKVNLNSYVISHKKIHLKCILDLNGKSRTIKLPEQVKKNIFVIWVPDEMS